MPKKQKQINLLLKEEFDQSITGRILRWAMTTFRYIVIVTELIVMGAFLSRFYLDAKNADLGDLLKVKSAQISAQSDFEKSFRDFQERLSIFSSLNKEIRTSSYLTKIISALPNDVTLSGITFQESRMIEVKCKADTESSVAQFMSNLKADKTFKSVTLGSLTSQPDNPNQAIFGIIISY